MPGTPFSERDQARQPTPWKSWGRSRGLTSSSTGPATDRAPTRGAPGSVLWGRTAPQARSVCPRVIRRLPGRRRRPRAAHSASTFQPAVTLRSRGRYPAPVLANRPSQFGAAEPRTPPHPLSGGRQLLGRDPRITPNGPLHPFVWHCHSVDSSRSPGVRASRSPI